MKELKKITREEWIAALRSGRYSQTIGRLHDTAGYCCLGVACALAGVNFGDYADSLATWNFDDVGAEDLYNKLNLTDDEAETLAQLNDKGKSFLEIANIIEKGDF